MSKKTVLVETGLHAASIPSSRQVQKKHDNKLQKFVGREVLIQTKSPSFFKGLLVSATRSQLVLFGAQECRWNGEETLKVSDFAELVIERDAVNFTAVCEPGGEL